ncbi:MAG: IS200/IS605 family accessory protein TnpB-related protein, partial [Aquificaceae bacterium]
MFLEGKSLSDISKELQNLFSLDSRYSYFAVIKAQTLLSAVKEKGKKPKKVIFGGRSLFEKLKKRHINGEPYRKLRISWTEKRKGNLYSIGQANCKGNQNTRIEIKENGVYLRINVGTRQYIYALIKAGNRINKLKEIALSGNAYSVELKVKDGEIYAYFTADEEYPPIEITKEYGVIGVDLNAYPNHMAWAETDEYGNLISYGTIPMPELSSGNKNKRDNYTWLYAHQVIKMAKTKGKAIVIERLDFEKSKNKKGDYSGRKIRRIQHSFAYKKLLSKIKLLAKRKGIQVIEINPFHTSTIGMLKYSPQYMLT